MDPIVTISVETITTITKDQNRITFPVPNNAKRAINGVALKGGVNFIKERGTSAAKLAEKHLRTNNRRTRVSTIRTLMVNMIDSVNLDVTDEELLYQYDLEIPMEEIDFSNSEE